MPNPLTPSEKAYFDTIKQVARSPRHEDLKLMRMTLDGRDVGVVVQRIIDGSTAVTRGFQPLAILCDTETVKRLRDPAGEAPESISPDGLEGAA